MDYLQKGKNQWRKERKRNRQKRTTHVRLKTWLKLSLAGIMFHQIYSKQEEIILFFLNPE
jgi:hypothetical protein